MNDIDVTQPYQKLHSITKLEFYPGLLQLSFIMFLNQK